MIVLIIKRVYLNFYINKLLSSNLQGTSHLFKDAFWCRAEL